MNKIGCSIIAVALGSIMPAKTVLADRDRSQLLPELTAEWRQWAYSIPAGQNPQEDATGQYCMVGQRGPIWFLAGVFLGGSATRACTVPGDKALFFPVINQDDINSPNVCGQGPLDIPINELRAATKSVVDSVTGLNVQVDGKIANKLAQRVKSIVYEITLPEENVFDAPCGGPGTVAAGVYSPAVDDGYYVLLEPLGPGRHTIHFSADAEGVSQDVTYNLTVVPVSIK